MTHSGPKPPKRARERWKSPSGSPRFQLTVRAACQASEHRGGKGAKRLYEVVLLGLVSALDFTHNLGVQKIRDNAQAMGLQTLTSDAPVPEHTCSLLAGRLVVEKCRAYRSRHSF